MSPLTCIVVASADEAQFNSARPVALHPVCGAAILDRVLAAARALPGARVILCDVAGREALAEAAAERQLGWYTGPLSELLDELSGEGAAALVIPAEMPLLDAAALRALVDAGTDAPGAVCQGPLCCGPAGQVAQSLGTGPSASACLPPACGDSLLRVASRQDLARAESVIRDRVRERLLCSGVTLVDPTAVWVDEQVQVGRDTVIYPGTVLQGAVSVGEGCEIGPRACVINSTIGDRTRIQDGAMVRDSSVGSDALVGHCSHVRSHSHVGDRCLLGSFAELVRVTMEADVTQLHFSYLGDSHVSPGANIAAGVITCNFDGTNKHETLIEEGAFVGSDAVLIAPLTVGKCSYVAAGSTITHDVPPGALAFGRARQSVKENWAGPRKSADEPQ